MKFDPLQKIFHLVSMGFSCKAETVKLLRLPFSEMLTLIF